jgi:hypothetical protein
MEVSKNDDVSEKNILAFANEQGPLLSEQAGEQYSRWYNELLVLKLALTLWERRHDIQPQPASRWHPGTSHFEVRRPKVNYGPRDREAEQGIKSECHYSFHAKRQSPSRSVSRRPFRLVLRHDILFPTLDPIRRDALLRLFQRHLTFANSLV